jgi:NAD(P)-dependent dehydrogenase (short-subunit alcohol dehydrogenase family)
MTRDHGDVGNSANLLSFPAMRELNGAVAIVTGAASGIGRALAVDLAKHGAQLALADMNSAGLEETHKLLGNAIARTYTVDVSKAAAVEDFARQVQQDFGRASLLINNAGVGLMGTFAEVSLEDMQWLIGINFWGVVHGCKFFLPMLQREPDAHIVNVSSIYGLIGPPGRRLMLPASLLFADLVSRCGKSCVLFLLLK